MTRTSRSFRFAATAAVAALGLLVTACGGSGGSTGAASDGKPVTIEYWTWTLGAKSTVDAFNRTHKDIKVKFTEIPSGTEGYSKLSNAVQAGNAPDVATIEYQMVPEFASQGNLIDLTKYAGETVKTKFPKPVQSLVTFGGRTWTVPYDVAPQLLYYRTDLFKKYGIAVPKTWDEFRTAAEKVRKQDKNVRLASFPKNDPALLAALAWQAGGKWFGTQGDAWKTGVNDTATKKVAAYWDGLVKDGLVQTFTGYSPEETKARAQGSTLAFLGASWSAGGMKTALPDLKGKWAAAPMPNWGTPAVGNYGGTSYGVLKGSEHAQAAAEFITWLTTDKAGVEARLADLASPSSALPANADMRKVAAARFDTSYFNGQDLYALASQQADTIVPGWTWGPDQMDVYTAIQDTTAKSGFTAGVEAGEHKAESGIESRGLKLAE
ncbi:ABC transporter substrate-binding protein [Streptomyces diastatochromogenes]|uniref:ABC transporter substrate-binding protein n=1 Tax=Streptomyces diastatochromogenes TaxID=42236 RepID=A0A233S5S9_STRDA|nr:sugar ABC transporter substrate-binding protein [Streptomyces diastatochromogenes]MCZ0985131.1 sugar ABC transporter substrate-binding protein [Streptomyces diastatochromogenes]OXY90934.1 ABC transporter substrate-binding protein [Streptomyces diastatochromogenes]